MKQSIPGRFLHAVFTSKPEWRQAGELEGGQEQGMKDRRRGGRGGLLLNAEEM